MSRIAIDRSRVGCLLAVCVLCVSLCAASAGAQTAENVAVVINQNSPDSERIGEYYARTRALPASHVIRIRTSTNETITRAEYVRTIEQVVGGVLSRERLQDRVLYLVLTKGVPLRIAGTLGTGGTMSSVDSELTLLYRRMTGQPVRAPGFVVNPYFLGDRAIATARPFTHRDHDIYLVSRLDAFTVDEALRLIDRASEPAKAGRIVLDQRNALVQRTGEDWLDEAAKRLTAMLPADQVLLEATSKPARNVESVLGYFYWGSTDPQNRTRHVGMQFVPGAIGGSFVATSARTFVEPPAAWVPTSDRRNRAARHGGAPESLVGDLIREGITGVAGYVAEPLLQGTIRPQILFPAYVSGMNLVEAYYLAMPQLSGQAIVIGDPLCAPFRTTALTEGADFKGSLAHETLLPAWFSERRMAVARIQSRGVPDTAIQAVLKAEVELGGGDTSAGRASLESAVEAAPLYVDALIRLASLDEREGKHDDANARYRKVLEIQPKHVMALNNLAYSLAVRKGEPYEGLEYAKRAASLAPRQPSILDTLAWVTHLTGDDVTAARVIAPVARANLADADIRLHAAVIFAAVGARAVAEAELAAALKLRPELDKSSEVAQIRATIAKLVKPSTSGSPRR